MDQKSSFKKRLLLASFPVVIVMLMLALEIVVRQHLLFTSLVSSAFLIYIRPKSPMNDTITIAISQGVASLTGYGIYLLMGTGLMAAFVCILIVTLLLTYLKKMHPPSIATSLIFIYRTHKESDLVLFGMLTGLIISLFILKHFYIKAYEKMGIPDSE